MSSDEEGTSSEDEGYQKEEKDPLLDVDPVFLGFVELLSDTSATAETLGAKLEEHPTAVTAVDGDGNTLLHYAAMKRSGDRPELASKLIEKGADPYARNASQKQQPHHVASEESSTETNLVLLEVMATVRLEEGNSHLF